MVLLALIAAAVASVVPLSDVRYDVVVSGPLADVEVTQTFRNDSAETIEATYLFPLHEGAVVDRMVMRLDDRTIEGRIEELEEAKRAYAEAVAAGKTAALTTSERWNLFRQKVGNIPPGAEVEVSLRVIQPVPRLSGTYELVLPLVAGARFVPPGMSDAEALAAPYGESPVKAHVRVKVDGGVPIDDFDVVSHLAFEAPTGDGWEAHASDLPMTRDFVVQWRTADDAPQVGALHDGEHLLLVFEPPEDVGYEERRPRELVFVVDRSGSMQGPTWSLTVHAVIRAMQSLGPTDRLRLVLFGAFASGSESRAADRDWVHLQMSRLTGATPSGTTDIAGALREALAAPGDPAFQRYVVLVSDGLIADEDAVFAELVAYRGESRVFALGAGGAANRFVLGEVADLGGGTVHWLRGSDGTAIIDDLVEALDRPVLSGVSLDWGDWAPTDLAPSRIPDVHVGRPQTVVARTRNEEGGPIVVSGVMGGERVEIRVDPRPVERGRAIASMWARKRIDALGRRQVISGVPARDEGLPLALEYGILSPWTAFVAIDPRERQVRTATIDVPLGAPPAEGRPDTGRTYSTATSMAAGVTVGPAPGPNIGGASTNENGYAVDTEQTTRGTVLTKEYVQRVPSGRSYQTSTQIARDLPSHVEDDGIVQLSRRSGGGEITDPLTGTFAMGEGPEGWGPLTRPWGLVSALDAGWMSRGRGHLEAFGGALGADGESLPRAGGELSAAVPAVRDHLGVRLDAGFGRREVVGGAFTSVPLAASVLAGDHPAAVQLAARGIVQDVGAPTLTAFESARRGVEGSLRTEIRGLRLGVVASTHQLAEDGMVSAQRRTLLVDTAARTGDRWAGAELGGFLQATDGTYRRSEQGTLTAGLGARLSGASNRVLFLARLNAAVVLGETSRRALGPELEVGARLSEQTVWILGASRRVGLDVPELALPVQARVYTGFRAGVFDVDERFQLLTGFDRSSGPMAPDIVRLGTLPVEVERWARPAWFTELSWEREPRERSAVRLTLRHTAVLARSDADLVRAVAPWVPGLLVAHRPLFGRVDGRVSMPLRGQWWGDLTLAGGVASPLPGVPREAWWSGWQLLGSPGLAVRKRGLSAGVAMELRQGRPDDPDPDRVDGWLAPDRLGSVGVMGAVRATVR